MVIVILYPVYMIYDITSKELFSPNQEMQYVPVNTYDRRIDMVLWDGPNKNYDCFGMHMWAEGKVVRHMLVVCLIVFLRV